VNTKTNAANGIQMVFISHRFSSSYNIYMTMSTLFK